MFYIKKGIIPPKRHTVFKSQNGDLYYEEHISREGFSSIYSNLYHLLMPTEISSVNSFEEKKITHQIQKHKNRHYFTGKLPLTGDAISSRQPLFFNDDITISKFHSNANMKYLYRNGHCDELIYIQHGEGEFLSNFGKLMFIKGDYIIIPRGVVWKLNITQEIRGILIESISPIQTPKKYRNKFGQLMEHSPYCERDIAVPNLQEPKNGKVQLKVNLIQGYQNYTLKNHPFDLVGWDGYYYPWKMNINDFEPITGSIHQPPPIHQTFEGKGFVVCSFVSRLFDYHPDAIPSPYPHSNVDSDELIFYSMGDFMSRNDIKEESITLHPAGITHGPHPGKYEASIGKSRTEELAVMIDTFKPLKIVESKFKFEDSNYSLSWLKD